ncbi:MAG: PBP1A family penicillin-binding protein [Acidobacteriota bacterium]
MKEFFLKNLKIFLIILSVIITILIGSLTGILLVYQKGLPQITNLEDIKPVVMTRIYDDNKQLLKEFAVEKRIILKHKDIPQILKNAIIVAEDANFKSHWGISFTSIFRAVSGVLFGKNLGGGSTITMQLARNLYLFEERSKRTFSRKLKEILLSIQIEKKYSKDQILTFYCNKIPFGGPAYGVEAASKYYFGKSAGNINLSEAALLTSIIPNPNGKYNVFKEPENCRKRRNMILKKMKVLKYISKDDLERALKEELPKEPYREDNYLIGAHFIEDIRKYLESRFGDTLLYEGGLKVYSTLNSEMQIWAEQSLKEGLRDLDKRRGWRLKKKYFNVLKNKLDIKTYQADSWKRAKIETDKIVEGIISSINNKRAIVQIKDYKGILTSKNASWTKWRLTRILKRGDLALFRIKKIDEKKKELELGLEQEPEVEGALIAIDNRTGSIKAMVGGYSFEKSKWNNAIQAMRQTGSTIKPIVYTAAIENGFSPSSIILDEPKIFENRWTQEPYEPRNHTGNYIGPVTFRMALEKSKNLVTARIVETITPPKVVEYARKFGITSKLIPVMSIGLGSLEITLKEMVAAYSVFPNYGLRVNPYYVNSILDQNNNIVEENFPDKKQVIEPATAYVMNHLLQGVVKYGSGFRARVLEAPVGGKTGTTNGFTDAWFIGYTPTVSVGVWVGYDIKRSLGEGETGSRAASPIFVNFMQKYLEKYPEMKRYRKPSGVIMVKIDKYTGKLFSPDCLYPFMESYLKGNEPLDYCTEEDHMKIMDYYGKDEKRVEVEEDDEEDN